MYLRISRRHGCVPHQIGDEIDSRLDLWFPIQINPLKYDTVILRSRFQGQSDRLPGMQPLAPHRCLSQNGSLFHGIQVGDSRSSPPDDRLFYLLCLFPFILLAFHYKHRSECSPSGRDLSISTSLRLVFPSRHSPETHIDNEVPNRSQNVNLLQFVVFFQLPLIGIRISPTPHLHSKSCLRQQKSEKVE